MVLIDKIDFNRVNKDGYLSPISQWKLFNDKQERLLGEKADTNFEDRKAYVKYYQENDNEYFEKGIQMADKVISHYLGSGISQEKRNEILIDMIYSLHRFGCSFDEYFLYDYSMLNAEGRSSFITDKIRYYLYRDLNLSNNHELFRNKVSTYNIFSKYYHRKLIRIDKHEDKQLFFNFIKKNEKFIVKPIDADTGKGVKIFDINKYSSKEILFNKIITMKPVVIEELIIQDDAMAVFHPQSLNTVRIPIIKNKDGNTHTIFHPFFRMGRGKSVVDNAGSGGLFADVDSESGIVYTAAVSEYGERFLNHPDSKKQIIGFHIPRWKEAIELVKEASMLTDNRYIGWDVALTENGWVIVEGNDCGQFVMQMADKVGRLKEILELI